MEATIDKNTVRQWKRYDKYRESGATWHSEVPADWEVRRLKFLTDTNPAKSEVSHLPDNTEVSFLPMEQVGVDGSLSLDRTKPIEDVYQGFTYFRDGDVLVAKITPCFENGKGAFVKGLANGVGFGTTEFHVLRPNEEIDGRFLELVTRLHAFRGEGVSEFTGAAGQQRVPESFLNDYKAPLPSLSEQQAIAAFLDWETTRIDALIGHKERLIALLEEKRQAVISHAVTRGLDPNAKMEPTTVEWLKIIPKEWKTIPLKYLVDLKSGDGITGESISDVDEFPVYGGNGFRGYTSSFTHDGHFVLIGRQGAHCGNVNYANGKFWASEHAVVAIPKRRFNTAWLGETLRAMNLNQYSMTAAQPGLSMEFVGNLRVPLPPPEQQEQITGFLESAIADTDATKSKMDNSIKLLKEYRTALISAAVTGQIDVREEATAQND